MFKAKDIYQAKEIYDDLEEMQTSLHISKQKGCCCLKTNWEGKGTRILFGT